MAHPTNTEFIRGRRGHRISSPVRHHPDIITSLRTESLAILAILYFLHALCLYFGITKSIIFITHHFDNQKAIRRLNELDDFEHKANPTTTDYDVWAAMKEATESQPGTHIGKYVKGHQRITKKDWFFHQKQS